MEHLRLYTIRYGAIGNNVAPSILLYRLSDSGWQITLCESIPVLRSTLGTVSDIYCDLMQRNGSSSKVLHDFRDAPAPLPIFKASIARAFSQSPKEYCLSEVRGDVAVDGLRSSFTSARKPNTYHLICRVKTEQVLCSSVSSSVIFLSFLYISWVMLLAKDKLAHQRGKTVEVEAQVSPPTCSLSFSPHWCVRIDPKVETYNEGKMVVFSFWLYPRVAACPICPPPFARPWLMVNGKR